MFLLQLHNMAKSGALNQFQIKENERITNITNTRYSRWSDNMMIMATYGIPTAGQPGFNIHNDAGDSGNNNQSTGGEASYTSTASTGASRWFWVRFIMARTRIRPKGRKEKAIKTSVKVW